jgi:outer membrane protein OmpA-like peptidoglycan-associated protein
MSPKRHGRAALLACVLAAVPPLVRADDCGRGFRWQLRGFGARIQTHAEPFETEQVEPLERTKFMLQDGDGLGGELEYRVNCPVGLTLGLIDADVDSLLAIDTESEWLMESSRVGLQLVMLGSNFHLTPRSRADLIIGAFVARVDYKPVSFSLGETTQRRDLDGETAIGLNAGLDFPLRDNSPWAVTAGVRYLPTSAAGAGFELDVDPLIATAGLAYRWNGSRCGPCEVEEAAAPLPNEGEPRAVPAPPPPPASTEEAPQPMRPVAPAPAPPPAPSEEREVVHFDLNSARVSNIGKAKLDEIALKLKQDLGLRARVSGHADSSGSDAINDPLSLRRAEAVERYLVERHSIDGSRITTEGLGSRDPVADNSTPEGRAENRRAVIIIRIE